MNNNFIFYSISKKHSRQISKKENSKVNKVTKQISHRLNEDLENNYKTIDQQNSKAETYLKPDDVKVQMNELNSKANSHIEVNQKKEKTSEK